MLSCSDLLACITLVISVANCQDKTHAQHAMSSHHDHDHDPDHNHDRQPTDAKVVSALNRLSLSSKRLRPDLESQLHRQVDSYSRYAEVRRLSTRALDLSIGTAPNLLEMDSDDRPARPGYSWRGSYLETEDYSKSRSPQLNISDIPSSNSGGDDTPEIDNQLTADIVADPFSDCDLAELDGRPSPFQDLSDLDPYTLDPYTVRTPKYPRTLSWTLFICGKLISQSLSLGLLDGLATLADWINDRLPSSRNSRLRQYRLRQAPGTLILSYGYGPSGQTIIDFASPTIPRMTIKPPIFIEPLSVGIYITRATGSDLLFASKGPSPTSAANMNPVSSRWLRGSGGSFADCAVIDCDACEHALCDTSKRPIDDSQKLLLPDRLPRTRSHCGNDQNESLKHIAVVASIFLVLPDVLRAFLDWSSCPPGSEPSSVLHQTTMLSV